MVYRYLISVHVVQARKKGKHEQTCLCCFFISHTLQLQSPYKSVTEFCYKSVNLSLEELKNIKITLFPIQELFGSAVMRMLRHAKSYKFKRSLSQNHEPFRNKSLYEHRLSAALIHHLSKISRGSIVSWFEFQWRHVKTGNTLLWDNFSQNSCT